LCLVNCAAQLHAEAGAARLRPGSRAACVIASAAASRRLQFATRFCKRHRRQPPRRFGFGTRALAAQLSVRSVGQTNENALDTLTCELRRYFVLRSQGAIALSLRHRLTVMTLPELRDVTGFRGERIVELCLTEYSSLAAPLFRPGFLGDKWPAIDFYVELTTVPEKRLYFFGQAKATSCVLSDDADALHISADRDDVERLMEIPAPTYILGVHEPSKRVFVRAVHSLTPKKAITRIPVAYELNIANLVRLHDEVRAYWLSAASKPTTSVFE